LTAQFKRIAKNLIKSVFNRLVFKSRPSCQTIPTSSIFYTILLIYIFNLYELSFWLITIHLYTLQQTTQQIKAIEEEKYPPDQSIPKSEKQEKEEKNDKKEEQSGKKETEDNEDEKTEVRESPVDHQETEKPETREPNKAKSEPKSEQTKPKLTDKKDKVAHPEPKTKKEKATTDPSKGNKQDPEEVNSFASAVQLLCFDFLPTTKTLPKQAQ